MDEFTTHPSAQPGRQRDRSLELLSAVGIVAAGVLVASQFRKKEGGRAPHRSGIHVHEAVTINRPIGDVYSFWRNFENFPTFMSYLESVRTTGSHRSHWRAKGPAGLRVEWEAEIVEERENELIAWRSIPGSAVQNRGAVRFEHAPGGRGTEVHVDLEYSVPGQSLGRNIARLFGREPEQEIRADLRRFKQLLETGEIPVSDGPGLWRPAQPAERPEDVKALMGVSR
jgi:uncharacterized membrane protein